MPPHDWLRRSISQRRGASLRRLFVKCGLSAGRYWAAGTLVLRGRDRAATCFEKCLFERAFLSMEPVVTGSLLVTQLRIPIGAASIRRHVQNGPERHQIGRTARILSGIGRGSIHFAAPEMPDYVTVTLFALREHVERRIVAAVLGQPMIVAAELSRDVLIQRQ